MLRAHLLSVPPQAHFRGNTGSGAETQLLAAKVSPQVLVLYGVTDSLFIGLPGHTLADASVAILAQGRGPWPGLE